VKKSKSTCNRGPWVPVYCCSTHKNQVCIYTYYIYAYMYFIYILYIYAYILCVHILYIYTYMHVYSIFCHNEDWIMSFVGKRTEREIIMLRKISQTQKDKYFIFYLVYRICFFFKQKDMKVEVDYLRRGRWPAGEKREGNRGGKYYQSTLYTCMKMLQRNTFLYN
jgi:hypothetical protein